MTEKMNAYKLIAKSHRSVNEYILKSEATSEVFDKVRHIMTEVSGFL